jgi:hypothetical protein
MWQGQLLLLRVAQAAARRSKVARPLESFAGGHMVFADSAKAACTMVVLQQGLLP